MYEPAQNATMSGILSMHSISSTILDQENYEDSSVIPSPLDVFLDQQHDLTPSSDQTTPNSQTNYQPNLLPNQHNYQQTPSDLNNQQHNYLSQSSRLLNGGQWWRTILEKKYFYFPRSSC